MRGSEAGAAFQKQKPPNQKSTTFASGSTTLNNVHCGKQSAGTGVKMVTLSPTEYDEYQRFLNAVEWSDGFNTISTVVNKEPNTLTQVEVDGSSIWIMVDTDAAANVMDELAYNSLVTKPALIKNRPYFGFGNPERPLDTLGQCTASIKWRGKILETNFVVMRGRHQNLIGRSTAVMVR